MLIKLSPLKQQLPAVHVLKLSSLAGQSYLQLAPAWNKPKGVLCLLPGSQQGRSTGLPWEKLVLSRQRLLKKPV